MSVVLHKILACLQGVSEPRRKIIDLNACLTSILTDVRHVLIYFESEKLLKYYDNKDDFLKNVFVNKKTSYLSQINDGTVLPYDIMVNLLQLKKTFHDPVDDKPIDVSNESVIKALALKTTSIKPSQLKHQFSIFIEEQKTKVLTLVTGLSTSSDTTIKDFLTHQKFKTILANFQNALECFAYIGIDNALQALEAGFSNELATQIEDELTAMHDCPFYKTLHLASRNESLELIKQQQQPKFVTEISVLTPPNETDSFEQLCNEITVFCKTVIASDYDIWLSILSQKLKALEQFKTQQNHSTYKAMLDEQIKLIVSKKRELCDFL